MPLPLPARGLRAAARARSRDRLREGFFELFRRSFRRTEQQEQGAGLAVYRASAPILHRLCGEPWAQSTIFLAESKLARRFLAETGLPVRDPDAFVGHALMANAWAYLWVGSLLTIDSRGFHSCCRVRGAEHLQATQAGGKGAILAHSHTAFTQLFWRWLEHREVDPGVTLWEWTWTRDRKELTDPKLRTIEGARELHAAVKTLRQGGLVQVLADGGWGKEKLVLEFYNRRRPFQPSFAELAVNTGAPVLTVDSSLAANGRIRIEIGAPLALSVGPASAGRAAAERDGRIEAMMREYAEHLRKRWRRHAACLDWFQMRRHLAYPVLEEP